MSPLYNYEPSSITTILKQTKLEPLKERRKQNRFLLFCNGVHHLVEIPTDNLQCPLRSRSWCSLQDILLMLGIPVMCLSEYIVYLFSMVFFLRLKVIMLHLTGWNLILQVPGRFAPGRSSRNSAGANTIPRPHQQHSR
jgi:hypothetical protein